MAWRVHYEIFLRTTLYIRATVISISIILYVMDPPPPQHTAMVGWINIYLFFYIFFLITIILF